MHRRILNHLVTQWIKFDLLICLIAYLLQPAYELFIWVFTASSIFLFWLIVTKAALLIDFLVNADD